MSPLKQFEDNIPLAEVIAFEYANIPGCMVDDARAEAYLALNRAAEAYDPARGEFIHFAARVIRNALNSHYAKQLRFARLFPKSLDDPIQWAKSGSDMEPVGSSTHSALADPKQDVLKEVRRKETVTALDAVLNLLSPRERLMVDALRGGSSYAEIGENLGITKQAAHKSIKSGLAKLRDGLARMGYLGLASDGQLGSGEKRA